jgi:2,5-diamino-6-(ribosylamino)-4(3H)-pyrimidinone 5'-phosphate reductase
MAMTADGKTDSFERRGAGLSSPEDAERVQALRAESDAVMVGGRTLLAEDPRLTVRSAELVAARRARGLPDQPMKVAVVSEIHKDQARPALGPASRFLHDGGGRTVVFTTERTALAARDRLRREGAEVVVLGVERVDLAAALTWLGRAGIGRALVEGGGTLVAALLEARLVDELSLYVAPKLLGGSDAPTPVDGQGLVAAESIDIRLETVERMGSGVVLRYRVPTPIPNPEGAFAERDRPPNEPPQEPAP